MRSITLWFKPQLGNSLTDVTIPLHGLLPGHCLTHTNWATDEPT